MALTQLSDVMVKSDLLIALYREPSITAYNRLEPRPRSQQFERSLRAEIRDPLWMLTRQWQMGEFDAEDAGSAIDARLLTNQIQPSLISLEQNQAIAYSDSFPMETLVEREAVIFTETNLHTTYGLRVKMGQYFLRLHSDPLRAAYLPAYMIKFGFDQTKDSDFRGQVDGLNLYQVTRARAIDGSKVLAAIHDGTFLATAGISAADTPAMNGLIANYKGWFDRQYSQPSDTSGKAWHSSTLDYQFSIGAPYNDGRQKVLEATEYYSGRLDWYAFTENLRTQGLEGDIPPNTEKQEVISFIPSPAEFKGMPNPRFWEMEERQIDFGKINAKTTDHLLLLFAEFGLIYGNDWSVIPYKMPVNTLCEVKGLVVTDVFGDRTWIRAANEGDEGRWQRWSMFNISNKDNIGLYDNHFYLPSTLIQTLESDPVEQVNFIRDEMANMAWGIEDRIPDAAGTGISGHEAADQTGVQPPPIVGSTAAIRYVLGTTVPENWIPFLPVHKPGSVQDIRFQRAAMPKMGTPPVDVVKAKGVLLNEVPPPYYINEEEIPYSGTIVTRSFQRVRWYDGKTYLWMGRRRQTGRGQGASNLRFDQIDPVTNE